MNNVFLLLICIVSFLTCVNPASDEIGMSSTNSQSNDSLPKDTLIPYQVDSLWGFKNDIKQINVEPIYEEYLDLYPTNLIAIKKDGKWGIINKSGNLTLTPQLSDKPYVSDKAFDSLRRRADEYSLPHIIYTENDSMGIISLEGNIITSPSYNKVFLKPEGVYVTIVNEYQHYKKYYGVVSIDGQHVIPNKYIFLEPLGDDLLLLYRGEDLKDALYDLKNDKFLIDFKYTSLRKGYESDLFSAQLDGVSYVLDKMGNILLEKKSKSHFEIHDQIITIDLVPGLKKDSIEIYDNQQNLIQDEILKGNYLSQKLFSYSTIEENIVLKTSGEKVHNRNLISVESIHYNLKYFNLTLANNDSTKVNMLINSLGDILATYDRIEIASQYKNSNIEPFRRDLFSTDFVGKNHFRIMENGKMGIMDSVGKVIVEPFYEELGNYQIDGLSAVKLNGKWGYMDVNGDIVIEPKYDSANDFRNYTLARVQLNEKTGYINATGKFIVDPQYDTERYYQKFHSLNYFQISKKGKLGLIDKDGNIVVEPKCRRIENYFHEDSEFGFCEIDLPNDAALFYDFDGNFIGKKKEQTGYSLFIGEGTFIFKSHE